MALVDYSDSDESGTEDAPPVKPTPNTAKPVVQKIVDRSNPGKIKVSLPKASSNEETDSNEPPTKRVKTGGGLFEGLASFLPAPKQTGVIGKGILGGSRKGGLGSGVNLKTGAAPGFSREPEPEREPDSSRVPESEDRGAGHDNGLQLPQPKAAESLSKLEEVKLVGKPLMFKPLSVARKPVKKKKQQAANNNSMSVTNQAKESLIQAADTQPQKRVKVSLFSMDTESSSIPSISTSGEYQPLIYASESHIQKSETNVYESPSDSTTLSASMPPPPPISSAQSLDSIASDLNLSASDRRQLFGRQKSGSKNNVNFQATNVINFNTDQEYAHNEELRASGEEVVHNPVRAIAPGKHSLKQLVNAAQTQKEALEESFTKGKTNRAEASSRYGW